MDLVVPAIVPVIVVLAGGAVLRRTLLTEPTFWRGLERLTYFVLGPALFVSAIASSDLATVEPGPLAASATIPIVVVTGLLLVLRRPLRATGPAIGSMVQGAIRINTFIGLVFIDAMHGVDGVAVFAIACSIAVPVVNVLCVSVLAVHGVADEDRCRPRLLREIATNPLILSCLAGLTLNLTGVALPDVATRTLDLVAAPSLFCGTLVAGASISLARRRRDLLDVSIVTLLKLVLVPLAAAALAVGLGASPLLRDAVVVLAAVPTAPSAAILSARLGGDTRLMAAIIGVQTVLATVTMPLMIAVAPA